MQLPQVGVPATEPKDGDFVAYLAEIERLQLRRAAQAAATTSSGHTGTGADGAVPAPLNAAQAAALRARLAATPADGKALVGPLLLALVGLLFVLVGLFDDAGILAVLAGGFLLWRAWGALRKAGRGVAPDAAAKMVALLRQARK